MRAQRAATALEQAWHRWRTMHGLGADSQPLVSSYVGYSLEEPWGQPRVVFGVEVGEAERLAAILEGHSCAGQVRAAVAGQPGSEPAAPAGRAEPTIGDDRARVPAPGPAGPADSVGATKLTGAAKAAANGQHESARVDPLDSTTSSDPAEPMVRPARKPPAVPSVLAGSAAAGAGSGAGGAGGGGIAGGAGGAGMAGGAGIAGKDPAAMRESPLFLEAMRDSPVFRQAQAASQGRAVPAAAGASLGSEETDFSGRVRESAELAVTAFRPRHELAAYLDDGPEPDSLVVADDEPGVDRHASAQQLSPRHISSNRSARGHSMPRLARPWRPGTAPERDLAAPAPAALPQAPGRKPDGKDRGGLASMAADAIVWASGERPGQAAAKDTAI
jgi:hypothetical protein